MGKRKACFYEEIYENVNLVDHIDKNRDCEFNSATY